MKPTKIHTIIVCYPCHNRLEYTKITLPQVINELKNSKHNCFLYVGDDNSTDGTKEYLETLNYIDKLDHIKVGNSLGALSNAFQIAKDRGATYVYKMDNDILMPDGIIDRMVGIMDNNLDACSTMVEECFNMPFINEYVTIAEHKFTSSLGIHRVELYPEELTAFARYFGFANYQDKLVIKGFKCLRVTGIGNTNLDGSAWSLQERYFKANYSRTGLVGDHKTVYKREDYNV